MAGDTLTTASSLQCPHGGSVQIISANTRAQADGAYAALATDTFAVSGCTFQIPVGTGTVPSPCLTVQWIVPDMRVVVGGTPTLSSGSVGLCLSPQQVPQGPVSINNTQKKVTSQ